MQERPRRRVVSEVKREGAVGREVEGRTAKAEAADEFERRGFAGEDEVCLIEHCPDVVGNVRPPVCFPMVLRA